MIITDSTSSTRTAWENTELCAQHPLRLTVSGQKYIALMKELSESTLSIRTAAGRM